MNFWLYAIISTIAYALQSTWIAKYARRMDGLSCALYRNLSLAISLAPLLLFVPSQDFTRASFYIAEYVESGIAGAVGLMFLYSAVRSLPVGITNALSSSIRIFLLSFIGLVFFKELLSWQELACMVIIFLGAWFLSARKYAMPHLSTNSGIGLVYILLYSICTTFWFSILTSVSRNLNPFLAAYIFEVAIGIVLIPMCLIRWQFWKKPIQKISVKTFLKILLISSPTLFGTGAFTLAVVSGKIAVVSAIGTGGIIVSTLLAAFLYREKLTLPHWIAIIAITAGIVGFRLG